MKKVLLAGLAISVIGLTACGGGDKDDTTNNNVKTPPAASKTADAAMIEFDCSAGWPMCEVNDPATGNVDFVLDAMTGIGGNTMGPLVTADAKADAATIDKAWGKVAQQFQISPADALDHGDLDNGRSYVVVPSTLNPGQTTYIEMMEKDGSYFSCQVSGTFDDAAAAKAKGEEACAYMK